MEVGRRNGEQQGVGAVSIPARPMAGHAMTFIEGLAPRDVGGIVLREEAFGPRHREHDAQQGGNLDGHRTMLYRSHGCRQRRILRESVAVCKGRTRIEGGGL